MKIYVNVAQREKRERRWRVVKGARGFMSNDFSS